MRQAASLMLILAAAWLVWSGDREALLLAFGGLSCALVALVCFRMKIVEDPARAVSMALRHLHYVPWILWEIFKSTIDVVRIILDPKLPIRPQLFRVKASQRSEVGQVIYANSITLTPGTISLDVRNDRILVHALTDAAAEGLKTGEMDDYVARLEGHPQ
jgi:multicomponent Na+:H+ antiporter subunit E